MDFNVEGIPSSIALYPLQMDFSINGAVKFTN